MSEKMPNSRRNLDISIDRIFGADGNPIQGGQSKVRFSRFPLNRKQIKCPYTLDFHVGS